MGGSKVAGGNLTKEKREKEREERERETERGERGREREESKFIPVPRRGSPGRSDRSWAGHGRWHPHIAE